MSGFPKNRPRQLKPIPEPPETRGRPNYKPLAGERRIVFIAAACGIPQDRIAKHLNGGNGISPMTLRNNFRKELNNGMLEANLEAAGTLYETFKNCRDLKVKQRATEFWLERRMPEAFATKGQQSNEPSKLVITVEGGLPKIEHDDTPQIEGRVDSDAEDTDVGHADPSESED